MALVSSRVSMKSPGVLYSLLLNTNILTHRHCVVVVVPARGKVSSTHHHQQPRIIKQSSLDEHNTSSLQLQRKHTTPITEAAPDTSHHHYSHSHHGQGGIEPAPVLDGLSSLCWMPGGGGEWQTTTAERLKGGRYQEEAPDLAMAANNTDVSTTAKKKGQGHASTKTPFEKKNPFESVVQDIESSIFDFKISSKPNIPTRRKKVPERSERSLEGSAEGSAIKNETKTASTAPGNVAVAGYNPFDIDEENDEAADAPVFGSNPFESNSDTAEETQTSKEEETADTDSIGNATVTTHAAKGNETVWGKNPFEESFEGDTTTTSLDGTDSVCTPAGDEIMSSVYTADRFEPSNSSSDLKKIERSDSYNPFENDEDDEIETISEIVDGKTKNNSDEIATDGDQRRNRPAATSRGIIGEDSSEKSYEEQLFSFSESTFSIISTDENETISETVDGIIENNSDEILTSPDAPRGENQPEDTLAEFIGEYSSSSVEPGEQLSSVSKSDLFTDENESVNHYGSTTNDSDGILREAEEKGNCSEDINVVADSIGVEPCVKLHPLPESDLSIDENESVYYKNENTKNDSDQIFKEKEQVGKLPKDKLSDFIGEFSGVESYAKHLILLSEYAAESSSMPSNVESNQKDLPLLCGNNNLPPGSSLNSHSNYDHNDGRSPSHCRAANSPDSKEGDAASSSSAPSGGGSGSGGSGGRSASLTTLIDGSGEGDGSGSGGGDIVVVTGGNGFLGQHVVKMLQLKAPHVKEIWVLDKDPFKQKLDYEAKKPVKVFTGSITDPVFVRSSIKGSTSVMHIAGLVSFGTFPDLEGMKKVNVHGTYNVVDACLKGGVSRLIFCSTVDVVVGHDPIRDGDEENTQVPSDFLFPGYPETKYHGECLALEASKRPRKNASPLQTLSLRANVMYGELDPYYVTAGLKMAKQRNGVLSKIGDGSAMFQQAYVGNTAWAFVCADVAMVESPDLTSQFFYVPDNTPIQNSFNFLRPYLITRGFQLSEKSIPYSVVYGALVVSEKLAQLVSPLKKFNLPAQSCSIAYINTDLFFRGNKAQAVLKYEPLFSPTDAKLASMKYYRTLEL